jgi:hypothetical protein
MNKSWLTGANRAVDIDTYTMPRHFGFGVEFDWSLTGDHSPEFGVQITLPFFVLEARSYDTRHKEDKI